MKILIIQENGRHEENRIFRECFCLQRSFRNLGYDSDVWGLGHENFETLPIWNSYDIIINLENYDILGWVPSLSRYRSPKKFLWSIDAHCQGIGLYEQTFRNGEYDILLHSTKDFAVGGRRVWFPNAYDDSLIGTRFVKNRCDVGFCGSTVNRGPILSILKEKYNFMHDELVIGESMVQAINSYKIHFNKNMSNDINYRNFETLGCGIPLLTNYNYQYDLLGFIDRKNVMYYRNISELHETINELLYNEGLRSSLAFNGHELARKHTYTKRAEKLIEFYEVIK